MDDDEETQRDDRTARHAASLDGAGRCVGVHIEFFDPGGVVEELQRSRVREWLIAAVAQKGATGEVRVRLVGDAEMSAAHLRYGGVAGTTDVLTFDMGEEGGVAGSPAALDVDLWVCVDEARRQASARGHGVEREILLYCLHGVLHCLGYDDHDPADFERMHAEEDRLLEAIGVGRTYASDESRAGSVPGGNG